jgi:hypothetical protein
VSNFRAGQRVAYWHLTGMGWQRSAGYRIVEPVSPYNKSCALIERIDKGPIDGPFNVLRGNLEHDAESSD